MKGSDIATGIERLVTSSYFTKKGGRRVGGHTRGNVEKKGIYKGMSGNGMELMKEIKLEQTAIAFGC